MKRCVGLLALLLLLGGGSTGCRDSRNDSIPTALSSPPGQPQKGGVIEAPYRSPGKGPQRPGG